MLKWLLIHSLLLGAHALNTLFGGRVVMRHFEYKNDMDENVVYINDHQRVVFNTTPPDEDLLPFSHITGYGYFINETFYVTNYTLSPIYERIQETVAKPLKTITFLLNICNQAPTFSRNVFLGQLLKKHAPTNAITLEEYYESCSLNQTIFSETENDVVGPIAVPCTGTTSWGGTFQHTRCGENEIIGWAQFAERNSGVDLSLYNHRIFVIPITLSCNWLGIADVGCAGGWCRSWIKSTSSGYSVQAMFHELGHNHGLSHATGLDGGEYSDFTSAMGGCCSIRCHNAPHAALLKWYLPIATLTNTTHPPGTTALFTLPPALTNRTNYLLVGNMYISYRTRMGYDITLVEPNTIHIHTLIGTSKTRLQAILRPGQTYTQQNWLIQAMNQTATVRVCNLIPGSSDCLACTQCPSNSPVAYSCCGDGVCSPDQGENCRTCPQDCAFGVVNKTGRAFCCGEIETTPCNFFRCRDKCYNACNATTVLFPPPPVPSPFPSPPVVSPLPPPLPFPSPPLPSPPPPSHVRSSCICLSQTHPPVPYCGNGICEAYVNEDCTTCPSDCQQGIDYCCGKNKTCTGCYGSLCTM